MRFGIVLVGANGRECLAATLEPLIQLKCPLVYVDMASIDDSVDVVRKMGVLVREMRIDQPISRARACNEGAALLMKNFESVELIQFIRVGCLLDPQWPSFAEKTFDEDAQLGALAGLSMAEGKKGKERLMFSDAVRGYLGDLNGGDFVARTTLLRKLKGFATLPRLGFETDFIVRAKAEGFLSRRVDRKMLRVDSSKVEDFLSIKPSYRQGYIQYYLIFKAPTFAGRMTFVLRTLWVSLWTLWIPMGIAVAFYADLAWAPQLFELYGFLFVGLLILRRYRIRSRESYFESFLQAFKMLFGFWSRLWGHLKAFQDLSTEETRKIFSKKKSKKR